MKKIISLLIAFTMLFSISSFAATGVNTGFEATYSIKNNTVTVKGNAKAPVVILIYPDGKSTADITNDNPPYAIVPLGIYTPTKLERVIQLDSSVKDEYVTVDITHDGKRDLIKLELVSTSYKNGVLADINDALKDADSVANNSSDKLHGVLVTYADYLQMENSDATGEPGKYIANMIFGKMKSVGYSDITEFDADFAEFKLRYQLKAVKTVTGLDEYLLNNAKALGIDVEKYYDNETPKTENTKLSDEEKTELLTLLNNNTDATKPFNKIFAELSALAIIRKADRYSTISYLLLDDDYKDVLALDMTDVDDVDAVAKKMMDKEFSAFSDIGTNFDAALSDIALEKEGAEETDDDNYTGGGGGGGGSSHTDVIINSGDLLTPEADFYDLPKTHWAYSYVNELYENDVISGYTDGSFKPNNTITRAEFMKIINSQFNYTVKSTANIPDLDENEWYANDVRIAVNMGYIKGDSNGNVNPEGNITRAEIAVAVARLMNKSNKVSLSFNDLSDIPSWAVDSVSILYANGIISGYTDNTIRVNNYMTRAEASVLLSKAFNVMGGVK